MELSVNAQMSFILTNAAPPPAPRRASIILIECDGLGHGDLSCYGQTKFQTPNLDRLAAEGIGTRPFFYPMHQQPVLHKMGVIDATDYCPVAERLYQRGFYIPSGLALTDEQIYEVSQKVRQLLN